MLAPAKSTAQMQQVVFNDYINASLTGMFMLVLISILFYSIRTISDNRGPGGPTAQEAYVRGDQGQWHPENKEKAE